jgi:hypothetical protein
MNKNSKYILKFLSIIISLAFLNINLFSQLGTSVSFSTDKAVGFSILYTKNENGFYLGFAEQLSDKKNTVVRERKQTYGISPIGSGDYYWLVDFGYSRTFLKVICLQPELSFGNKNYYTNYSDKRFKDDGYTLITSSETIAGIGANLGYKIKEFIEPYCGFHTTKKLNFGVRIHFNSHLMSIFNK